MDSHISSDKAPVIREKTIRRLKKYSNETEPLKRQLLILEDQIDDYASLVKSREKDKTFSLSILLETKSRIKWRLNYLKDRISIRKLEGKFDGLNKRSEILKNQDENYGKELAQSIEGAIERYKWYLRDLLKWEPEEWEDMFSSRDAIEILKQEITDSQELREIENKLEDADEELKKQVPKMRDKIIPREIDKIYPKSFWWRHLKETR